MIIVTGGAGFIGSAFVWKLNKNGIRDIVIVDDLESGIKWKNLLKRDFRDVVAIDAFADWLDKLEKPDKVEAIFHMGACSSTTETDVDFLLRNNVNYSKNLYQFCTKNAVPFYYASSAATYGAEESDFADEKAGFDKRFPINPYGMSKELFDRWIVAQDKQPPVWVGYKYFNVYGPNEYHKNKQSSVICQAYPQIKETGRLKLFKSHRGNVADGEQKRDFVYVKDVVEVMYQCFKRGSEIQSGIYNLGCGEARTFIDLGSAVFKSMDQDVKFDFIDTPESIRNQYQYYTKADLTKLRSQGFANYEFYSLEDGIKDYVQGYLMKEDRYL